MELHYWKELRDHLVSPPTGNDGRTEVALFGLVKERQTGIFFHFTIKDI